VEGCTSESSFLAHTYAAESLCDLGRPADAVEHLTAALMQQHDESPSPAKSNVQADREKDDLGGIEVVSDDMAALTGDPARAALYINLAAVYASQGEHRQAEQCSLQALKLQPSNPHAMLALVYVQLASGHDDMALSLLKWRRLPAPLHDQ